jgi:hypothetical protein
MRLRLRLSDAASFGAFRKFLCRSRLEKGFPILESPFRP